MVGVRVESLTARSCRVKSPDFFGKRRSLTPRLGVLSRRHTSVVVYDTEWYFGQGILAAQPGTTLYGTPVQTFDMGVTSLPNDVFLEFIGNLRDIYRADSYHLLDSNCNNFTSDVVQFLTNKDIPVFIKDLPAEVMRTPFGQMIRPMIEGMFGSSRLPRPQQPPPLVAPLPSEPPLEPIGVKCSSPFGNLPLRSLRSAGTTPVVLRFTTRQNVKRMFEMLPGLPAGAGTRGFEELRMMEDWVMRYCTEQQTNKRDADIPSAQADSWLRVLREVWEILLSSAAVAAGEREAFPAEVWPFLDMFRLLAVGMFAATTEVDALAQSILKHAASAPGGQCDKTTLTALRVACNALSFPRFRSTLFLPAASSRTDREPVTALVVRGLLSGGVAVRRTAASVCWNLVLAWADRDAVFADEAEEAWILEILSAVVEHLKKTANEESQEEETAGRVLAAFALLLLFCPVDSSTDDLLEALEAQAAVNGVLMSQARGAAAAGGTQAGGGHLIEGLCADVIALVKRREAVRNSG